MNLMLILTVSTVLLLYCNYSWQQLTLATDLALQRTVHSRAFYQCEGLLNYGLLLAEQKHALLKSLVAQPKRSLQLYQGPWPLATLVGPAGSGPMLAQGQLVATYQPTKKNWQLVATLYDGTGRVLCQLSYQLEPSKSPAAKFTAQRWKIN